MGKMGSGGKGFTSCMSMPDSLFCAINNLARTKLDAAKSAVILLIGGLGIAGAAVAAPNYGEALQKSIYFYEAQQSGALPSWNRVPWRADATTNDGADVGVDLSGGWYDAGDHVKFGLPMASAATLLAWGVLENPSGYQDSGQLQHIRNNLKFVADYFVAAHPQPNLLYGQVGLGGADHGWWGPVEVLEQQNHSAAYRPVFAISSSCPGSDLAGETAAALAAISMVFKDDASYSNLLKSHAIELYQFADTYRGKYSDCITDAQSFYNSWSGYRDELTWSAAWLYKATGESSYLTDAESHYLSMNKGTHWTHSWDDKAYGTYVLLAQLTGEAQYKNKAEHWLDYWTTGDNGDRVSYTPDGFAQLDQWGASRYAANTSFLALVYSDYLSSHSSEDSRARIYYNFAVRQMEYLLGDNLMGHPYQVGLADWGPVNPHHRTAHGSWDDNINNPGNNRHLLIGALVGGPGNGDAYADSRNDYVMNEVAVDYNAGFTSALARLYQDFGGNPIPEQDFPPAETATDEFLVESKLISESDEHLHLALRVHNRTAWPARETTNLTLRYWMNLGEVLDAGYQASDLTLSLPYEQGASLSAIQSWGSPSDQIYYVDIAFAGTSLFPGSNASNQKEAQLKIQMPFGAIGWNSLNDPSWDNFSYDFQSTDTIALYEGSEQVSGNEPILHCGTASSINCPPTANPIGVETQTDVAVSIALSGLDSDGSITDYDIVSPPAHGSLSTEGHYATYFPATGFAGTDSFSYRAVDNLDAVSVPAEVNISVVRGSTETHSIAASCKYVVTNEWSSGWNSNILITNITDTPIEGWQLFWEYEGNATLRNGWSAEYTGESTSSVSATPVSWNYQINPGETITIGFTSDKARSGDPLPTLQLNGDICQ